MIFNRLFYYIPEANKQDPLLRELNIPFIESEQKEGFYLQLSKYGQRIEKKLSTNLNQHDLDVFIDRPLTLEQFQQLKSLILANPILNIYILAHKLFDLKQLIEMIKFKGISNKNIYLLYQLESRTSFIYQENELLETILKLADINRIPLKIINLTALKKQKPKPYILPFALMTLMKVILTPTLELKKAYHSLKVSQFVWSKRLHEFFSFLFYIISTLSVFYHLARYFFGISQRLAIPAYFKTRHVFLMSRYKSYGFLVDTYYLIRAVGINIKDILKIYFIKIYFLFRHLLLMAAFKTYGFFFDIIIFTYYFTCNLLHKIYFNVRRVGLMILYPVFKIYWFTEFQYYKRIKKNLWME